MLLFASLAERLGRRSVSLEVLGSLPTVAQVRQQLLAEWPALVGRPFRIAVQQRYAEDQELVPVGAELALIPPVSGG